MLQLPNRKKSEAVVTVTRSAYGREEIDGKSASDNRDVALISYRTRQLDSEDRGGRHEDQDNFRKPVHGDGLPIDRDIDR